MTPEIAQNVVRVAQSKLGATEEGGANRGPIVEWSLAPWTDDKPGEWAHWCCAFVCTSLFRGGSLSIKQVGSLSCPRLWQRCENKGWTFENDSLNAPELQPGDVVFFVADEDFYHVGLVESFDSILNRFTTIEGNAADSVLRREYSLADEEVYGFARMPS